MVPAAQSWKLKNAVTGAVVAQSESGTSARFAVPTEVHTTSLLGMATARKASSVVGKKVTPEATGAVPQITDITADKTTEGRSERNLHLRGSSQ